jgi:hypothetical protein
LIGERGNDRINSIVDDSRDYLRDYLRDFLYGDSNNNTSKKEDNIFLDYSDISDLEGLQYFKNVVQVNLSGNSINNVNVLPQLKNYII